MKHKIGDKVSIRTDLKVGERYDGVPIREEMIGLVGETLTISNVNDFGEGDISYYLNEDEDCYHWTDSMFEDEMTNADRIRNMSDEELAEFLRTVSWEEGNNMFTCDGIPNDVCEENDCKLCKGFLWWLQQPANL